MWWKLLILIVMVVMIVFSFIEPAPQKIIGEASRIFYYHIPQAWISVLAFAMSMIYSIRFLKNRSLDEDDKAAATAGLGFMFCLLATVTGAIFAKVTWGSFWNWDPRETSIFILLLIYGAYFALRGAIVEKEKRAALSAVYAIFAFITVPFLIFVVPRIVPSLHPSDSIVNEDMKFTMGPSVRTIFFSSLIVFTAVYFWMFNIARRTLKIKRQLINEDI
ncbi:MAG: cytochrome c biogenesis protein [bacterium]